MTEAQEPAEQPKPEEPLLQLNFHGRIIEHLGLQMYQSPTAALAELISNAWDADAPKVEIFLPAELTPEAVIEIKDTGCGMTLDEVRSHYLKVGINRRGKASVEHTDKGRPILGRKGIGKFAGFGISRKIIVETISEKTGERTRFEMDYDRIRGEGDEYVNTAPLDIPGAIYEPPDEDRRSAHGTTITLATLVIARRPPADQLRRSMSRRFSFGAAITNFEVVIDNDPVPTDADAEGIQFSYPRDYAVDERPETLQLVEGEWGTELLSDGRTILWRYRFYQSPINESELAGVAVFTQGKVAQMPFLFNLAGGLSGQHGAAYMSGRVEADYLDTLPRDIISPERQRIDWEAPEAASLLVWGQERTKSLLSKWRQRRGDKRRERLAARMAPLEAEIARLSPSEQKTLRGLLRNLALIESIDDDQFLEMADRLFVAFKAGRLKGLIEDLAEAADFDEGRFVNVLVEADVLTDLQLAEIARTRIGIVSELRRRVETREIEGSLRDHIAAHPFLISPRLSTFARETRVNSIIENAANESGISTDPDYAGRIDLALAGGTTLLIIEFMRPGITLDVDHIQRFQRYVAEIRPAVLVANNALGFAKVEGIVIADNANRRPAVTELINGMARNDEVVMTWDVLLASAEAEWRAQMDLIARRAPYEPRIAEIIEGES